MAADDPDLIAPDPIVDPEDGLAPLGASELPEVVVDDTPAPPLGRSWAFDFGSEQFERGRGGAPLETRGVSTLMGWIDKCLRTARGALPIHPAGYGVVDPDSIFGRPISELSAGDLENRFRDALTFHPRIADVADLTLLTDPTSSRAIAQYTIVTDPPADDASLLTVRTNLETA